MCALQRRGSMAMPSDSSNGTRPALAGPGQKPEVAWAHRQDAPRPALRQPLFLPQASLSFTTGPPLAAPGPPARPHSAPVFVTGHHTCYFSKRHPPPPISGLSAHRTDFLSGQCTDSSIKFRELEIEQLSQQAYQRRPPLSYRPQGDGGLTSVVAC